MSAAPPNAGPDLSALVTTSASVVVDETEQQRPPLFPAAIYLSILVVLVLVSWQTIAHTTSLIGNVWSFPGDSVLGGLARYDGGWYLIVSTEGYRGHTPGMQSPVAFFPGHPLAMRLVGAIVRDNAIAGILITVVSGATASVLFWSWCRHRMAAAAATTSLLVLLLYPYSYVIYGAIYTEAFFLLATLIAFWAVENDRPLLAGIAGAIATVTRPVGIAVAVGLAVRLLERRGGLSQPRWLGIPTRVRLPAARPRDSLVLISVVSTTSSATPGTSPSPGDSSPKPSSPPRPSPPFPSSAATSSSRSPPSRWPATP